MLKGRSNALAQARQSPILAAAERLQAAGKPPVDVPAVPSFRAFLEGHARVKTGSGYAPYSFAGREVLSWVVDRIDAILGSNGGAPVTDAALDICGGAQFGKTVLVLNLKAYATGVLFRNVAYYLPDDDLVQGIIDTKDRPDVIDQIPWYAELCTIGKTVNASGRAVNRKGAFMVTDGRRSAQAYMRGMGKIPTTFSADIVIEDEKDDIPEARAKFLAGRMTSSDLRFHISIGTQRYHGAGQNKQFERGTQHVGLLACPGCGARHNPEESWPGICRVAVDGRRAPGDPRLTLEGDFRLPGDAAAAAAVPFAHDATYYLACPACGAALDRADIVFEPRRPEREKLRRWSVRVSQLSCSAIDLVQIVADWCQNAVRDPESMRAFCCDRLALPKSTAQALTPQLVQRAQAAEPVTLSLAAPAGAAVYAGLDTGDRCWFVARAVLGPARKRLLWAEQISAERVRARVPQLCATLGVAALFVDAGPLRDLARDLALQLNGLAGAAAQRVDDPQRAYLALTPAVAWDGPAGRWRGLKAACVEFSLRDGQGVRHKLGQTQDGAFYPLIAADREETIQRIVNELLTAAEGVVEVLDGKLRTEPSFRLPSSVPGAPAVVETYLAHLLSGSRKERTADGKSERFVDGIENHFLLATAYAGLAEAVCDPARSAVAPPPLPRAFADSRSGRVLAARRERSVVG